MTSLCTSLINSSGRVAVQSNSRRRGLSKRWRSRNEIRRGCQCRSQLAVFKIRFQDLMDCTCAAVFDDRPWWWGAFFLHTHHHKPGVRAIYARGDMPTWWFWLWKTFSERKTRGKGSADHFIFSIMDGWCCVYSIPSSHCFSSPQPSLSTKSQIMRSCQGMVLGTPGVRSNDCTYSTYKHTRTTMHHA